MKGDLRGCGVSKICLRRKGVTQTPASIAIVAALHIKCQRRVTVVN